MKFKIKSGEEKGKIIEVLKVEIYAKGICGNGFGFEIDYLFEGERYKRISERFENIKLEQLPAE
jgi:hypothetical protein